MDQILEATRGVDGGAGVLYLYGNYGGDVLNFDLAGELADAEGITVATVLVADDVASARPNGPTRGGAWPGCSSRSSARVRWPTPAGRSRRSREAARHALAGTRSMGVGLSPTILPAAGKPTFELADGEMEIGIGIHGEPGVRRAPLETADEVADDLLGAIATDLGLAPWRPRRGPRQRPWRDAARGAVHPLPPRPCGLTALGVEVHRPYIGEFATSLEMAGASLTVMRVDDRDRGWLDAPASSPFYRS